MDTKKAIELVKDAFEIVEEEYGALSIDQDEVNEIVTLLKQGEKYKEMWEELEKEIQICALRKLFTKNVAFGYLLDVLKQKYFPKELNEKK